MRLFFIFRRLIATTALPQCSLVIDWQSTSILDCILRARLSQATNFLWIGFFLDRSGRQIGRTWRTLMAKKRQRNRVIPLECLKIANFFSEIDILLKSTENETAGANPAAGLKLPIFRPFLTAAATLRTITSNSELRTISSLFDRHRRIRMGQYYVENLISENTEMPVSPKTRFRPIPTVEAPTSSYAISNNIIHCYVNNISDSPPIAVD